MKADSESFAAIVAADGNPPPTFPGEGDGERRLATDGCRECQRLSAESRYAEEQIGDYWVILAQIVASAFP
jgi:hypothetical protein